MQAAAAQGRPGFAGIGFGAIQAGLFLLEARRSGRFGALAVAEVVPQTVAALRRSGGRYAVNVATASGLERHEVDGVEAWNPAEAGDAARFAGALAAASEIATALPSVDFYERGAPAPADLLAEAFRRKAAGGGPPAVVYTAENHNRAAELLAAALARRGVGPGGVVLGPCGQCLNTVIGKMSGTVEDPAERDALGLVPAAAGLGRAFLVEAFNRILVSRVELPGFRRGLAAFAEKDDLLPFEEAKLYGHNAVHALLGYLAHERGHAWMSDLARDPGLLDVGRGAFLEESRPALLARHAGRDPLFTPEGYRAYAEDLLGRMLNPWLRDRVERVIRDPRRKLGWDDRLVGTARRALAAGVEPRRFARGIAAAVRYLAGTEPGWSLERVAGELWGEAPAAERARVLACVRRAAGAGEGP